MSKRILPTAAVVLVGLTACASPSGPGADAPGAGAPDAETFLCAGQRLDRGALVDPVGIDAASEAAQEAVAGATYDDGAPLQLDGSAGWTVVSESDAEVVLLRPLDPDDPMTDVHEHGMGHDHEQIRLTTELWDGWAVGARGGCAVTVDLDPLGVPLVAVDPASPPTEASTSLELLVLDPSCGGDTDMPERIEVVSVTETDSEVRLLLAVQPLPGAFHSCEGFPPTPFSVALDAPLGDRTVIDDSRFRERVLAPAA